ncbi:hypothetical protein P7F88_10750 [Vibrio hannami]|nr:hypothetical protein [Vibrio hannami]MDG3086568.1 hypothetical protein [Vibrio hannami]
MKKQVLVKKAQFEICLGIFICQMKWMITGNIQLLCKVLHPAGEVKEQTAAVSLGIEYSRDEPGGELKLPSNITLDLYHICLTLFDHFFMKEKQFEKISVSSFQYSG